MSQQNKKKRYRLNSVSISELSLVDKGAVTAEGQALGKNFILFKNRDGGNNMELKDLEAKEAELKKKEEELNKSLAKKDEDVKKLEEKLKKAEDVIKANEAEIAALKAKIEELDPKKDADKIAELKAKIAELSAPVEKGKLSEEDLTKEFTSIVEVIKVGRKISKKNIELIKTAMDSLNQLMKEIQEVIDAEEVNKAFEALPKEEQESVLKQIEEITKSLDE